MSVSALASALMLLAEPAIVLPNDIPVAVAPPATQAPATQAPATQAPTSAPAATPAPAAQPTADESGDDEGETIVVSGRTSAPKEDPLEEVNIKLYAVDQAVDTAVVGPAAAGYKKVIPSPIRAGVRNFFTNLEEPVNFLNFLFQFKIGKAGATLGRFALNSTIGVAGVFDMAKRKPFKLPFRRNGFANTMGYYGIKTGAYLHIPLIGPTTVRDLIGLGVDRAFLPLAWGAPFGRPYYTIPASAVGSLDYRVEFDAQLKCFKDEPDPYAAARKEYLRSRELEIEALHGRHPPPADPDAAPDVACTAAETGVRDSAAAK